MPLHAHSSDSLIPSMDWERDYSSGCHIIMEMAKLSEVCTTVVENDRRHLYKNLNITTLQLPTFHKSLKAMKVGKGKLSSLVPTSKPASLFH